MTEVKVGVVGGTGYTGAELLRLLVVHPYAQIEVITSRSEAGRSVADLYPNLRGYIGIAYSEPDDKILAACDIVFFATPHGVAQSLVPSLIAAGTRVIDISADFRIRDVALWESWYGQKHACPELVRQAIYGLPELNREAIKNAQLVACPGCYPTSVLLGFLPLLEQQLVDTQHLIASCASGASGAGRQAKVDLLLSEISDSFKAYGVSGHRHLPEIEQGLGDIMGSNTESPMLTFVPHLLPMIRGIHSTLYARLLDSDVDLQALYEQRYQAEPFVDVLPAGVCPQTRSVRGTNLCRLSVHRPLGRDTAVVTVVEDNLTKGASGQAIQNMNLMLGFDESTGLNAPPALP